MPAEQLAGELLFPWDYEHLTDLAAGAMKITGDLLCFVCCFLGKR